LDTNADINSNLKPVRLGKKIELKYIPFSQLAIPWNVCDYAATTSKDNNDNEQSRFRAKTQIDTGWAKKSRILKNANFDALKRSIAQFGLLKPFEVAEMRERLDFFHGKRRYLVIDGQRRYFAIRELLNLPTEDYEKEPRDDLRTDFQHDYILKAEKQAHEQFERLSLRHFLMIPCLVYPYVTLLQMIRHRIEDKRFSEKPSKEDLDLAEKMAVEDIEDLNSDDLRELWKMRGHIEDEKKSIERTLQEIKNRLK